MATLVISYARVDQPQVRALVKLLRAALPGIEEAVFWDDDFEAGEPWFQQICGAIDGAQRLFVFWCGHSAASTQVARETAYAFSRGCRVVPVLLDDTPLSPQLAPIQGIDLRDAIVHIARLDYGPRDPSEARPVDAIHVHDVVFARLVDASSGATSSLLPLLTGAVTNILKQFSAELHISSIHPG